MIEFLKNVVKVGLRGSYDRMIVEKFNRIKENNEPLCSGENCRLYAWKKELNGYEYIRFNLITRFPIKTAHGGELIFFGKDGSAYLTIPTDFKEIESDFAERTEVGITDFDVELTPDQRINAWTHEAFIVSVRFFEKGEKADPTNITFDTINTEVLKAIFSFPEETNNPEEEEQT